jgi:hypothetical protein
VKDVRAFSAVPVVRHDVEVIGIGLDCHAGGVKIVALWKEVRYRTLTRGDSNGQFSSRPGRST